MKYITTILFSILIQPFLIGQTTILYDNFGNKIFEGDTLNGAFIMWSSDSTRKTTGFFLDGKSDSLWIYYDSIGRITQEILFDRGTTISKRRLNYFKNGNIQEDLTIRTERDVNAEKIINGYRDWIIFYDSGIKQAEMHFINGEDHNSKFWDKNGNEISREEWEELLKEK